MYCLRCYYMIWSHLFPSFEHEEYVACLITEDFLGKFCKEELAGKEQYPLDIEGKNLLS